MLFTLKVQSSLYNNVSSMIEFRFRFYLSSFFNKQEFIMLKNGKFFPCLKKIYCYHGFSLVFNDYFVILYLNICS